MERVVSDKEFIEMINVAIEKTPTRERGVAAMILVSIPTVKWWASGDNLPHHAMRLSVAAVLR